MRGVRELNFFRNRWVGLGFMVASAACSISQDLDGLQSGGGQGTAGAPLGGAGGDGGSGEGAPCATGLVIGQCPDPDKCTLAVPGQGLAAGLVCGPAGSSQAWAECDGDGDCADGLWCESATRVCKPWCTDASTCPEKAACVVARRQDGTAVPGLTVCTAHCRPDNPIARCGPGVTCIMIEVNDGMGLRDEGDCAASGGKNAGCLCSEAAECAPGLRCDETDLRCHAWCEFGGLCAGGGQCGQTLVTYDQTGFGQCAALACPNN